MHSAHAHTHGAARTAVTLFIVALLSGVAVQRANAQSVYSYFPSASTTDARFLAIAGSGYNTLAGETMRIELATAGSNSTLEFGIFDGETGASWDENTQPLVYTLYASPDGVTQGTQVGQWSGTDMANYDNAWYNISVTNSSAAQAPNGNYIYTLVINSSNANSPSLSAFKIRCAGTIKLDANQSFSFYAPLSTVGDRATIYPGVDFSVANPDYSTTTYDGSWDFYLEVPVAADEFVLWDGDMDRGDYNSSDNDDTDDADTPNNTLPSWAVDAAEYEGVAVGAVINNVQRTGFPCDDQQHPLFRRSPSIMYTVYDPLGNSYANNNPSGNLEWEQFRISTATYNSSTMDYHADEIVAGLYRVHLSGVDMKNLNAWYFFNQAVGSTTVVNEVWATDEDGVATPPMRPYKVYGKVFYDNDADGVQDTDEPGIPVINVYLDVDRNNDGRVDRTISATTDADGAYSYSEVAAGRYKVRVDLGTLHTDVVPVSDPDGVASTSANNASFTLSGTGALSATSFGYKRVDPNPSGGTGTATRGYWVNHPEDWPSSANTLSIGGVTYTKAQCLEILKKPTRQDKSFQMAAQLIAAKLNVANGCNSSCVSDAITAADSWLQSNTLGSRVSSWGSTGESTHNTLDDYNNGELCEGHMD